MKTITKEFKREIKETTTYYVAVDGTEFSSESECEKYEMTAAAVLLANLKECELSRNEDMEWIDPADENKYRILFPTTAEHIDYLNQLWFMFGGQGDTNPIFSQKDKKTIVLLGYRFIGAKLDWVWFYKLNEIINRITKGNFEIAPVNNSKN